MHVNSFVYLTDMTSVFALVLIVLIVQPFINAVSTIPDTARFIGDGYNLLMGNPDGGYWSSGGDDPGLLLGRSILSLSNDNVPDEISYQVHLTCHEAHSMMLVHGPKSYQEKLFQHIELIGTNVKNMTEGAFTLSNGYQTIKQQTELHHYVYQDQETRCMLGKAVYQLDLASNHRFSVTEHFAAAVCSLPLVYDVTKYMSFLDTWGTHIVTEIELGWKEIRRYGSLLKDFLSYVINHAPDDVTIGGPYNGVLSSYHINLDSFKYRHEFNTIIGYLEDALKFGTATAPEPIGMKLTTIDWVFSNEYMYWKNLESFSLGQCSSNISQKMNALRTNIIRALNEYASYKNAETPTVIQLAIPVTWPNGTYGIPRPKTGCPQGITSWKTGWRYEDTETQDPSNTWSSGIDNHMEVEVNAEHYNLSFCIKSDDDGTFQLEWPKGDYCIFKYKICPKGFEEGFVRHDDEDTGNRNSLGGYLPDGVYDANTEIRYCCRSDGNALDPIVLPSDGPFYLFQYKHGCQSVRDMAVTEEYLVFDDDDKPDPSTADIGPVHPGMNFCNPPRYPGCGTSSQIFYCYYHALGSIISSIIG